MIRFTKLTDYAVVIMCLMQKNKESPISAVKISRTLGIPAPTVSKILFSLLGSGLLVSSRGRVGGYYLAKDANDISLLDISTAIEGEVCLVDCCASETKQMLAISNASKKNCQIKKSCNALAGLSTINKRIKEFLASITLKVIYDENDSKEDSSDSNSLCSAKIKKINDKVF